MRRLEDWKSEKVEGGKPELWEGEGGEENFIPAGEVLVRTITLLKLICLKNGLILWRWETSKGEAIFLKGNPFIGPEEEFLGKVSTLEDDLKVLNFCKSVSIRDFTDGWALSFEKP